MESSVLPGLVSLLIVVGPAFAQTPGIDHQPVACVTAEKFPRLEARLTPPDQVAAARVVFQGQTTDWYLVAMRSEGGAFSAVLPKPMKSLKSFRYYIEVTDKALGTNRTTEYTVAVVDSASACQGKLMAVGLTSASVILQGPAGVAALPAGFASSGVVAGSAAGSGSAVGAAGAGGGAGGGIGATALVLGGVAVAGGAVAVGMSKGGDDSPSGSTGSGTSSGNVGAVYNIRFLPSPPGIDVSVCAGRSLTWGSQALSGVDAGGNFNMTWAPNEPNTLRISGQLTATNFQATLACVSGAQSGSISATGSNSSYSGTFTFGNSNGQVSIAKQ